MTAYVRCKNKSFIINSNSGGGVCGTACAGVKYVCLQIWNVLAVVLHIIGFPTDRCCACLGRGVTAVTASISPLLCCFRSRSQSPLIVEDFPLESRGRTLGEEGRGRTLGEGRGRTGPEGGMNSMPTGGGTGSVPKPSRGVYSPVVQEV